MPSAPQPRPLLARRAAARALGTRRRRFRRTTFTSSILRTPPLVASPSPRSTRRPSPDPVSVSHHHPRAPASPFIASSLDPRDSPASHPLRPPRVLIHTHSLRRSRTPRVPARKLRRRRRRTSDAHARADPSIIRIAVRNTNCTAIAPPHDLPRRLALLELPVAC
jgi:hypothetical protein